ncbi:MAG TPA: RyR domain-containing protein [Gemmatimonadales bacterium]|jgi:hypothetical protein|nr:RyR domain-containing protein [Gemmatimonadales bacterium]
MSLREAGPQDLPAAIRERLARAIHERYRRNQLGRKPASDPAMRPWEELAETLKNSNRAQAVDIGHKLEAIGCRLARARDGLATAVFAPQEVERLAVLEHERWVAERRAAGWSPGPVKDVERKLTPHLVPWEELAEETREYDREAVRAIPELLGEAGFEVRRGRS